MSSRLNAPGQLARLRLAARAKPALQECLDVMLRMIPEYVQEHGAKCCTDQEHNQAIGRAARALYGPVKDWPEGVRKAAQGKYP